MRILICPVEKIKCIFSHYHNEFHECSRPCNFELSEKDNIQDNYTYNFERCPWPKKRDRATKKWNRQYKISNKILFQIANNSPRISLRSILERRFDMSKKEVNDTIKRFHKRNK